MIPSAQGLGLRLQTLPGLLSPAGWAGVVAHRNAVEIREAIRQAGDGAGHVATLFPLHVLDANPIRPEFAAGPFFFRTAGLLPPERIAALRGIGAEGLEALFAADPPAAISGGLYGTTWLAPMDAALIGYAERHGYRLVRQGMSGAGSAGGRLYLRSPDRRRARPEPVESSAFDRPAGCKAAGRGVASGQIAAGRERPGA